MAFNPDEYLAKKEVGTPALSGGFDPDAYLEKKAGGKGLDVSRLSRFDEITEPQKGSLDTLEAIDRYIGVPVRTAQDSLQKSVLPNRKAIGKALYEGVGAIGKDAKDAPTALDNVRGIPLVGEIPFNPDYQKKFSGALLRAGAGGPDEKYNPQPYSNSEAEEYKGLLPLAAGVGSSIANDPLTYLNPEAAIEKARDVGGLIKQGVAKGGEVLNDARKTKAAEILGNRSGAVKLPEPPPVGSNIRDLEKYVGQAEKSGEATTLPKIEEIREAQSRVKDLKHPLRQSQEAASTTTENNEKFGLLRKSGTKTSDTIGKLENLQKRELESKIDETINAIAPSKKASADSIESAGRLQDDFMAQYKARQKELGKSFEKYDAIPVDPTDNANITNKIAEHIPEIKDFVEVSDAGASIRPYSPAMGVSKDEYRAISETVNVLNNESLNVKQIRNMRGALLREYPNPLDRPPVVQKLRSALLDHLQDVIATKSNPAERAKVVKTFRDYAVNEQNLSELEKVFGGSFSDMARPGKEVVPEKVLDRMFKDSKNANIAKNALGDKAFNAAMADYLNTYRQKFTKDGQLSAAQFGNWLQKKEPVLWDVANPDDVLRLVDLNTLHRAVDLPPVNPSNTAPSALGLKSILNPKREIYDRIGTAIDKSRSERGAAKTYQQLDSLPKGPGLLERKAKGLLGNENAAILKDFIKDEEGAVYYGKNKEPLTVVAHEGQEVKVRFPDGTSTWVDVSKVSDSISPVTRPLPPAEPGPRPPKKPLRDPKKKPEKPKK